MKRFALALVFVIAGIPVLAGLCITLIKAGDLAAWKALLQFPGVGRSTALSLWTGCASTVVALSFAHLTIALAGSAAWAKRLRVSMLPLIALPHLAVAIGLALVLAPSGLILRLLSPWATGFHQPPDWQTIQDPYGFSLIIGLIVKETPFLILMLLGARAQIPVDRLMLQARALGYAPLKAWWVSVAPLLQRQIRLPLAATLVFAVTNVEMAIPLGPAMPPPLAVVLWQWFTASRLELRAQAFAGSVLLLLVALSALAVACGGLRLGRTLLRAYSGSGCRGSRHEAPLRRLTVLPGLSFILAIGAVAALALRSVNPLWRFPAVFGEHLEVDVVAQVAPSMTVVLGSTVALACWTAVASIAFVTLVSEALADEGRWRRRVGALLFAPLLLPQLAFLFGLQSLLLRLRLDGTWLAVAGEHTLFALPYVWGVLAAARAQLDPRLLRTSRSLGVGNLRSWWAVTLPLQLRSIMLAAAVAFSVSAALYLPTLFAGAGRVMTIATEATSAASSGNLRLAAVYGGAQAIVPLIALLCAALAAGWVFRNRQGVRR
jgi:putative thiamine transport system permease protein